MAFAAICIARSQGTEVTHVDASLEIASVEMGGPQTPALWQIHTIRRCAQASGQVSVTSSPVVNGRCLKTWSRSTAAASRPLNVVRPTRTVGPWYSTLETRPATPAPAPGGSRTH